MVPLSGPNVSVQDSIEQWVSLQNAGQDEGALVSTFKANRAQRAKQEGALSATGPRLGVYNARVNAILAREL